MITRRARTGAPSATCRDQLIRASLDPLDARRCRFDARRRALLLDLSKQLLLHFRGELQPAFELHSARIGVDRLRFREVDHRREHFRRFEDDETQPGLFRFDRSGNSGNAAADDRQIHTRSASAFPR